MNAMLLDVSQVVLRKGASWRIPESYELGDSVVVPMWAGEAIDWQVASRT